MRNFIKGISVCAGLFLLASCAKNENDARGTLSPTMSIAKIKALHKGDDVQLAKDKLFGAYQITGVVISDKNSGNFDPNEIVIQNTVSGTTAGLIVRFTDANTLVNQGDSVKIDVDNTILTRKNGALKIIGDGLNTAKVFKIASNVDATVQQVNLTTLHSGFYNYESTLVRLNSMSFDNVTSGQTYAGDVKFFTEGATNIVLSTRQTANFAQKALPLNADFIGVPAYYDANSDFYNRAQTLLKLRNEEDVMNETGAPYLNFPETFEGLPASSKSDFLMPGINDIVTFTSGNWKLYQAIIGNQAGFDRFNPLNGTQSIRIKDKINESAYLQMEFDLPNGASKVEVMQAIYGQYTLDPKVASAWELEYSQDQGATWSKIGNTVEETNTKNPSIVTFNMNLQGSVRFRIKKLGYNDFPTGQNGMLNIDDFTVYQNVN